MDSFIHEYGFILISIAAMGFLFYFFIFLPAKYKTFEVQLMSSLTGVPVEELLTAQQTVEDIQNGNAVHP